MTLSLKHTQRKQFSNLPWNLKENQTKIKIKQILPKNTDF